LEEALDTLDSAFKNVPEDWTPGVFAGALHENLWDELIVNFSEVEEQELCWLWKRRFPLGKVAILEGDPDVGKSTVTLDIAARVTRGGPMPDHTVLETDKRGVLVVSTEDDISDTMVPRLRLAGADMKKVHGLQLETDDQGNAIPIYFPDDMGRLRHAIKKVNAALVIIDPITGFLSEKILSNNDSSVRRAMTPMAQLAEETGVCILMIRHLNKSGEMKAKYRGGGSIAFTGASRAVFVCERHPSEKDTCVMAKVKMNLAKASAIKSLAYSLVSKAGEDHPRVEWTGEVELDADSLLRGPDGREDSPDRDEAEARLHEFLEDGPKDAKDCIKYVQDATGVSERTIQRARQKLGIVPIRDYDKINKRVRKWVWMLPDTAEGGT